MEAATLFNTSRVQLSGMALPRLSCFTIWCVVVSLSLTSVIGSNEAKQVTTTKEPSSLKEMMDFFGKLANDSSKEKVLEKLEKRVKEYFDPDTVVTKGIKTNLEELLKNVQELRTGLLNAPQSYVTIPCLITSNDNVDDCVNQVIHWLPTLRSMFWFIYFNTATECLALDGCRWSAQYVGTGRNKDLNRWLTDQPSQEDNNVLKRGFKDTEFKTIPFAAQQIENLGVSKSTGGTLDHAQFGLFMLDNKWNKSNLASVTLFLKAFCKDVEERKLKGQEEGKNYIESKEKCTTLISAIDELHASLWPLYNPSIYYDGYRDVHESAKLKNKSQRNNHIYEGKLKEDRFDEYSKWLTENISNITKSVKEMHKDSSSWTKEDFDKFSSIGPFKYGFVFKDKSWDGSIYQELQSTITKLQSSLIEFLCCYDPGKGEELKKELEEEERKKKESEGGSRRKGRGAGGSLPSGSTPVPSPKAPTAGGAERPTAPSPAHPGATHNEKSQVTNNASTSEGSKEANPKTTESSEQSQQGTDYEPGSHAEQAKEALGPGPANTIDGSSEGGEQSQHEHVSGQITDPETPSATGKGGAEKTSEATNLHDPSKHLDDSLSLKASMGELPRTIVAMVASLILF